MLCQACQTELELQVESVLFGAKCADTAGKRKKPESGFVVEFDGTALSVRNGSV